MKRPNLKAFVIRWATTHHDAEIRTQFYPSVVTRPLPLEDEWLPIGTLRNATNPALHPQSLLKMTQQ